MATPPNTGQATVSTFPEEPQIALSPFQVMTKPNGPRCNLRCEYCFYLGKTALYPPGESFRMTDALLERYVREYITAQPDPEVTFLWQGGEPTLLGVDFFRRAVELQRRYLPDGWVCSNSLQTNGTLLDERWGAFLREHRFLVGISIDGPAELHDRFRVDRHGQPSHARVMAGLHLLQDQGVEHNVLCVVNRLNGAHPLAVYEFFRAEGVRWLQFIPIVERVGDGVSEATVEAEAYGAFLVKIFDEWVRHDIERIHVQIFEECLRLWLGLPASLCVFAETCGRGLAMEHDGSVFACDHFVDPGHLLGTITDTPLTELARSPAQRRFGLDKRDCLPAQCRSCPVRFACNGGCPKDRFRSTASGEEGLNYLCEGYFRFFTDVGPLVERMAGLWRKGRAPAALMDELARDDARPWRDAGRNDACPCGSGVKFKRCCSGSRTRLRSGRSQDHGPDEANEARRRQDRGDVPAS